MPEDSQGQDCLLFHGLEQNGFRFSVNPIALQVEFPAFNFDTKAKKFSVALDWVLIKKNIFGKVHFLKPLIQTIKCKGQLVDKLFFHAAAFPFDLSILRQWRSILATCLRAISTP